MTEMITAITGRFGIFAVIYALIFIMVVLDLWSGMRKAKKRGEFRSSYGLRRTTDKLARYYNVLLALSVADCLQMVFLYYLNQENGSHLPLLPFMTTLGALLICIIEIKSMYESADKKVRAEYQEAAKILTELLKSKTGADFLQSIIDRSKDNEDE